MYNVGIVGLGHVAEHQVAALKLSKSFRLVAGCDADPGRFSMLDPSVRKCATVADMLVLRDVDVVIVASPNRLHVDHGAEVLEAGKWLVMEKPLAETARDFARIANLRRSLDGRCTLALHAAFGVELEWFCRECDASRGDLVTFEARFYDPYFENGRLRANGRSLGGSWLDSGINALSVVCRFTDPQRLSISDSRMTRVAGTGCAEVQGTVEFAIDDQAAGFIDTNWTIGRNHKSTLVGFANDPYRYLLDHSAESVARLSENGPEPLFSSTNDLPRLTNHYVGVFADLAVQMERGADNFEYGSMLHDFLYRAAVMETKGQEITATEHSA